MSWSTSLAQYTDIISHLGTIKTTNARQATFTTPAAAQRWRARVYMYRTLLRKEGNGTSPYDRWIFRITKDNPHVVQILDEYPSTIEFHTADGGPISLVDGPADPDSEQAVREAKYQAEMDATQAELSAAMRRPPRTPAAPQTPPPETPDISDSSGVDTTDPFGWNNHKEGSSNE